MNLWDEMSNDGDEFLATFGREITFRGGKKIVLISASPVDQMMADGGFVYRASYRIRMLIKTGDVLRKDPPKQGESVDIYGRPYTVVSVTDRPPSPWIDLSVQSATQ